MVMRAVFLWSLFLALKI